MYRVTFDTDGGSEVADQTIIYGNKITKPADPTKTGYIFDNWYTDDTYSTVFDFDTIITSDTTIYAKYNINTYTVTLNPNGGTVTPTSITVNASVGSIIILPPDLRCIVLLKPFFILSSRL